MWAAAFDRVSAIDALIAHKADVALTSAVENVTEKERADRAAATAKRRTAAPQQYPDRAGGANAAAGRGGAAAGAPAQGQRGGGGGRGAAGDSANAGPQQLSYGQLVGNKGGLTPLLFAAREGNLAAGQLHHARQPLHQGPVRMALRAAGRTAARLTAACR